MCDYPNCDFHHKILESIIFNGDKKLTLCPEHHQLYHFIKKILEFENDWGF
jgi:hypothetical protein